MIFGAFSAVLPTGIPAGLEAGLLATVIAAAVCDIRTRHIPNWITLPGAALGLALQCYYGGVHGMLSSLGGALVGMSFFFLLYLAGGLGAGDVKLAGAVGALVGPKAFAIVFVFTGLLGGIAAVALALWHSRLHKTLARTGQLLRNFGRLRWDLARQTSRLDAPEALRLPYGAVIAGGALAFLAIVH